MHKFQTCVVMVLAIGILSDCYHDQILYHDNLTDPLTSWNILTDDVHYAHTIAGDDL